VLVLVLVLVLVIVIDIECCAAFCGCWRCPRVIEYEYEYRPPGRTEYEYELAAWRGGAGGRKLFSAGLEVFFCRWFTTKFRG